MTAPSIHDARRALARAVCDLRSRLETDDDTSPAAARTLRALAERTRSQAQHLQLPACAILLRCVTSALTQAAGREGAWPSRDAPLLAVWCALLVETLESGATAEGVDMLLTLLGEVASAPVLDAASRARIARALQREIGDPDPATGASDGITLPASTDSPSDGTGSHTAEPEQTAQPRQDEAVPSPPSDAAAIDAIDAIHADADAEADAHIEVDAEVEVEVEVGLEDGAGVDADADAHARPGPDLGVRIAAVAPGADPAAAPVVGNPDLIPTQDVDAGSIGGDAYDDFTERVTGADERTCESAPAFAPVDSPATSDGETSAQPDAAPLWISAEELAVTCSAIGEQVLPLALTLAGQDPGPERDAGSADLAYHFSLVANAMEMLGLPVLGELLALPAQAPGDRPFGPEESVVLAAAVLSYLEHPGPAAAAELAATTAGLGVATDWPDRLALEAGRIAIGVDPAVSALRKRTASPGDVDLGTAPDVLPNVLESMLRELPLNAERLGQAIRALAAGRDPGAIDEARRVAHTLKGDANTVGCFGLANVAHSLEDILIELLKRPEVLDPALSTLLLETADAVEECADHLLGRGRPPTALLALYQRCLDAANALLDGEAVAQPASGVDDITLDAAAPSLDADGSAADEDAAAAAEARSATLAVDATLLDELQRLAGEVLILGRRIDRGIALLAEAQRALAAENGNERLLAAQLDDLVALRGAALQSTQLAATTRLDALELDQYNELHTVSRRIIETHADTAELLRRTESVLMDLDPLRVQQERLGDELQRAVDRTRTVPFGRISARLQRVVRQTARNLGKDVGLQIEGEDCGLDAELLDRLVEPLSHLLRNAVDHGIEDAPARLTAGKPAAGAIRVTVRLTGDSAQIAVRDDGAGLDDAAIRRKAEHLGLLDADASPSRDALLRLVLRPGFSTREAISHVSGRGVGMDVVNQRIRRMRGTLSLASQRGAGTEVVLRVPVSRTIADVVVAAGHGVVMAVVAAQLDKVCAIAAGDVERDDSGELHAVVEGRRLRLFTIESLYRQRGPQSLPGATACLGLVLSDGGDGAGRVLCVREVTESTRAIIKPVSNFLPPIPGVRGMTQLGDGRIAPVCDVPVLIERLGEQPTLLPQDPDADQPTLPYLVIADDSLSVRRSLEQLFQDAGYRVGAARDGMEAVGLIQQRRPAAVIVDLEMPRMNGLEVCRLMRNRTDTQAVPVVMITSRASDKYRVMADEAGVNRLLGKPYAEDELLDLVRELIAAPQSGTRPTSPIDA